MDNWQIAIILIILLIVGWWFFGRGTEGYSEIIYLDQMAMANSDPTYFKYSSWERDVDGNSPRDYYLENQTNYLNRIAPGYFEGDQAFVDHTDYLNMPPNYRPESSSAGARTTSTVGDTRPKSAAAMSVKKYTGDMDRDVNMAYTWQ